MHTEPPAAGTPTTPTRELDRSLLRGIAWTGGGKWLTQIISWIATPIVARLLSPADYGVAGMAMVYVGLVQLLTDFGLGAAILQRRDLDDDQVARIGGVALLLGTFFFALSVALAPLVAGFFGNPDVEPVIMVLSIIFLVSSVQIVPRALLTRDLHFRRLATLDAVEALTNVAVTLTLAATGFRYWALIFGGMAGRVTSMVIALAWRGHRVQWPTRFHTIAAPVRLGAHVAGSSIAWYTYMSADLAIIGRRLGSVALGSYSIAVTLASIPVDRLSALIARVSPAILAKVQHDRAALRRYVLALAEGTALVTFPAAVGLALVAREFVLVVLDEEWVAAITPLRLLALAAMLRSVLPTFGQVLVATGESRRNMQNSIVTALVLIPAFYIGSYWGIGGVALVWLIVYPFVAAAFTMRYGFAACDMTVRLYLGALWPALSATIVMTAAVIAVDVVAPEGMSLVLLLVLKCVVGAATYLGLVWHFHGARLRRSLAAVREPGIADDAVLANRTVPRAEVGT